MLGQPTVNWDHLGILRLTTNFGLGILPFEMSAVPSKSAQLFDVLYTLYVVYHEFPMIDMVVIVFIFKILRAFILAIRFIISLVKRSGLGSISSMRTDLASGTRH